MQYLQVRKEGLGEQQGNVGVVFPGRDRKYKFSFILFLPTVRLNSTRLDHPISSEIYSRRSLIEVSFQIKILISARDDKLKAKHGSIGLKIKMRGKQLAIIFFYYTVSVKGMVSTSH